MILDLIQKQKESMDIFFENLDPQVVESFTKKMIEINQKKNIVYWTGVGKSRNIASHSADMVKSMGITTFMINPIEALHGDMGVLRDGDLIVIYSKSGNTQELVPFLMHLTKLNVEIYGIFCNPNAKLSKYCTKTIILPCGKELDNDFDLVPTTSISVFTMFINLVIGYYLKVNQIDVFQYGKNHPLGNIGKRIWLSAKDIMYTKNDVCIIEPGKTLLDCMVEMTSCRTGYAIMIQDSEIIGIISDGDIRRHITTNKNNLDLNVNASVCLNKHPTTIYNTTRVIDIVKMVNENLALSVGIPVVDDKEHFVGYIDNKILMRYSNIF
jgi:arabinose-5-phosphate isomerase